MLVSQVWLDGRLALTARWLLLLPVAASSSDSKLNLDSPRPGLHQAGHVTPGEPGGHHCHWHCQAQTEDTAMPSPLPCGRLLVTNNKIDPQKRPFFANIKLTLGKPLHWPDMLIIVHGREQKNQLWIIFSKYRYDHHRSWKRTKNSALDYIFKNIKQQAHLNY